MKDKGRTRGTFKVYLQWPLFLSVLLVILTAAVGAVSIKAGIIVSVFTIVYIGIALWLYFSRRRVLLGKNQFRGYIHYLLSGTFGLCLWSNSNRRLQLGADGPVVVHSSCLLLSTYYVPGILYVLSYLILI